MRAEILEQLAALPPRRSGKRRHVVTGVSDEVRFWAHVDIFGADDCWLWTAAVHRDGYGVFMINKGKTSRRSNRFAFELDRGRPPATDLQVMHSCEDRYPIGDFTHRLCCNPRHLSEGNNFKNMQDCSKHGRIAKGERSGNAKWTTEIVLEIRRLADEGMTHKKIGLGLGVPEPTVGDIVRRKVWRHV